MRRTERICEAAGVGLVEVSSHSPARPDHAAWQGRVFSLHGDATVGGVRYRDLREATGYGTVTGLGGANCRHFFGPWLPGTPRMYEPDPPHPSGLPDDEVYALTQRQRARERSIRAAKRELACAQSAGEKAAETAGGQWSMRDIAEVERLKAKLRGRQKAMRDFIEDANSKGKAPVLRRAPVREWAGDMPRIRKGENRLRRFNAFPQDRIDIADNRGIKRLGRKEIERLQSASDKAFSDMTTNELDAVIGYTTGKHNAINQRLYGRKLTARQREIADMGIAFLDKAIGKFKLNTDLIAFSGTNAAHYDDWAIEETRTIEGYLSTSVRQKDARGFAKRTEEAGKPPMMIRILVPRQTPCLFIGKNTAYHTYQGELLLNHGLKYKVLDKTESTMTLEVVPWEHTL